MISKKNKFPMRTDFLRFRGRAKRTATSRLTIFTTLSPKSRLAVVVPSKVSKLATTRNWLRRCAYDTLWPVVKDKNVDCVVVFKAIPLRKSSATKSELVSELSSVFTDNRQPSTDN